MLSVALIVFCLSSAFAQMRFPGPAENPYWIEQHGQLWSCSTNGLHGSCSGYFCQCDNPIYYKSDTIINHINYNQLYIRGICLGQYVSGPPPAGCPFMFSFSNPEVMFAIIRQDTIENKVYIRINQTDELLYDFNAMVVGSDYPKTFTNIMNDSLVTASEEIISINGKEIKKWQLGFKRNGVISDIGFASILEGIGSTLGLITNLTLPFENIDRLSCFSLNNIVYYPDSSYICDKTLSVQEKEITAEYSIYPNPVKHKLVLDLKQIPEISCYYTLYNSTGKIMSTNLIEDRITQIDVQSQPVGLYLIKVDNGKKTQTFKFVKE